MEDDEETQLDIQELLILKGRKTNSDNDHLKPIHQIKLNLTVDLPSRLYYYKRWVWMNFPWICLYKSTKSYSRFINGIEAQETRTGAVYLQCLGIVYMNRVKKMSVLSQKKTVHGLKGVKSRMTLTGKRRSVMMKKGKSKDNVTSVTKKSTRFELKNLSIHHSVV